jgi:hypothetical protein
MTSTEFNKKYEAYLEPRHYGLAIDDAEVVEYLDERFQEFIKIPEFSYSQIKEKWGYSRFYCSPNTIDSREVETHIDNILNKK